MDIEARVGGGRSPDSGDAASDEYSRLSDGTPGSGVYGRASANRDGRETVPIGDSSDEL